jgi:hypothetical protein
MKPCSSLLRFACSAFAGALAFLAVSTASAQSFFDVRLNTSALIGHPAGPFYLDFQLTDGAGTGNHNNNVTVSQFNFGGGSFLGGPVISGGASGNLATSVQLTDSSPLFNEFFQGFTPGSFLSFRLSLTGNPNGPTPDAFAFSILDADLFNVRTTAPGNSDALIIINLTGPNLTAQAFAGSGTFDPNGATTIAFPAPIVVPVPEPSTYGLAAATLLGAAIWMRRRTAVASMRKA